MAPFVDKFGRRYGRLLVIARGPSTPRGASWLCRCDCGVEKIVRSSHLHPSGTQSCGCKLGEIIRRQWTSHGRTKSSEYNVWQGMKARCFRPQHHQYRDYGGRGITICPEWLGPTGFSQFLTDMGPRPSLEYTVERLDNDLDYCPTNCRWATRKDQARNSRANRMVKYRGVIKCVTEWAEIMGLKEATLRQRLSKGWDVETAMTTSTHGPRRTYQTIQKQKK